MSIIDAAVSRSRTTLLVLLVLVIAGASAYITIPKESEPDVAIPNIYVSMTHEGISPLDAERLLVRPMEQELQTIEGLKEMTSTAGEGYASIMLEFDAGFDSERALRDVREQVDLARPKLPSDTDEPRVSEVNVALFPVLTAVLSGPVPETSLVAIARDLKDKVEGLPGVLEVDIGGDREEVVDVIVDPTVLETYQISFTDLFNFVRNNNQLIAAGALDTGSGRFAIKVPGVIESIEDVLSMPIKADGQQVITVADVAEIRYGFKDPNGFARVDGDLALSLEVTKRVGANIIETVDQARALIEAEQQNWPSQISVTFLQDKSKSVKTILGDLQNNIIGAVLLVMIVIVGALGFRAALLVGLAIPGSFLAGILVIDMLGLTLNIVSLFSLILVVGMLVDGAIVVVELADRRMKSGMEPRAAFAAASKRMAWPIIASTATTLAVFVPLLFWPGMVGQFMKYLPITVIACLAASLAMALIFVPVLGAMLSSKSKHEGEPDVPGSSGPLATAYLWLLERLLKRPGLVAATFMLGMVGAVGAFAVFGEGSEFFPEQEPEYAQVHVRARGDLSVWEKDQLVRAVEQQVIGMPEVNSVYSRTLGGSGGGNSLGADVIGNVQLEFTDWQTRRTSAEILRDVRELTANLPGIIVEARTEEGGLTAGKAIVLELSGADEAAISEAIDSIHSVMAQLGGFVDIEDDRALPGNEWRVLVDREEAARFGADTAMLGNAIRLVTNGIFIADYRPDNNDEEVDIRLRFADADRHLDSLNQLRVMTQRGMVPISNFVSIEPAAKSGLINRTDGIRTFTLQADVEDGLSESGQLAALQDAIASSGAASGVGLEYRGQDEDQRDAQAFLTRAFLTSVALMAILLVTQFNSIYQAVLVLSAIVFSSAGVLLVLLFTGQPFGIVMCGIAVIALAGIVVNNNIILIDTYNRLINKGVDSVEAALTTCARRLRPVLLTAVTTVLGLMPMVLAMNPDFVSRTISFGAPSTQLWTLMASSIAGGLVVATGLTLILTPCLLVFGDRVGRAIVKPLQEKLKLLAGTQTAPVHARTL